MMIPWNKLRDAGGLCRDYPEIIREIYSDDADIAFDCMINLLYECVTHQGTTYTVTPFVVQVILQGVESIKHNRGEILGFLAFAHEYGDRNIRYGDGEREYLKSEGVVIPRCCDIIKSHMNTVVTLFDGSKNESYFRDKGFG